MIGLVIALAAAAAIAPPPQTDAHYTVKAHDTLIGLGARWFVRRDTWPAVQRLNKIADPYRLTVGKVLNIPRDLLRVEPLGAKVIAFRGSVSLDLQPPRIGSPVREGMAIATGRDASITIECSDGSRISLPSQTQVGVARMRRVLLTGDTDRVFSIATGRGEWSVSHAPTPNSRFMVTTPVSVSAVRGTGFRVGFEEGAAVGVVNGTVSVSDADLARAVPLPQGKGVAVSTVGVGRPVDLLPRPELLRPGRVQAQPELTFAIRPIAGAKSYVYEIGRDAGLIDRLQEVRGAEPEVRLPSLPDGSYFVRVTATDPNDIDGFSETVAFERFALGTQPPRTSDRVTLFRWTAAKGVYDYRFALYTDAAATRALIDRAGLIQDSFAVTRLPGGTYWWRVTATRLNQGRAIVATSDLQSFTIASRSR